MDNEEDRRLLAELSEQIRDLAAKKPTTGSAQFESWRHRARSTLIRQLGPDHAIVVRFDSLIWFPVQNGLLGNLFVYATLKKQFQMGAELAQGLLHAAESERFSIAAAGAFDVLGIDPELWTFVGQDIERENWGKAATQATLFVEDRIRRWTSQPATRTGEGLMSAVFGADGDYRLGRTDGEKDGWHQFARGIFKALRNAAAHRIEDRPDHRRYVLGVVGSCSLLLTQLRFEHGNRFHAVALGEPVISPTVAQDSGA